MTEIVYQSDRVTLWHGDCLEVLPQLGKVDAVVTDPPYGLNLGDNVSRTSRGGYASYDDTWEMFLKTVPPCIKMSIAIATRGACFMSGNSLCALPRPSQLGGIYVPSGSGAGPWGFTCFHPIAFYGHAPWAKDGLRPNVLRSMATRRANDHPCSKPIEWMLWLVAFTAMQGETILDPFMGSGTTGVAALSLGCKFIGIEIERRYVDIAIRRIKAAESQPSLFPTQPDQAADSTGLFA